MIRIRRLLGLLLVRVVSLWLLIWRGGVIRRRSEVGLWFSLILAHGGLDGDKWDILMTIFFATVHELGS